MSDTRNNTEESLRRVFLEGFSARDLAEPLASFDLTTETDAVGRFIEGRMQPVVGLRVDGLVTSYVECEKLDRRPLQEQAVALASANVVKTSAPFQDIIEILNEHAFLLVIGLGQPIGTIVREDLQKAPMRMWLFGMVTLFEMKLTGSLRGFYSNDSWTELVSEARMEKAQQLQAERLRRNKAIDLIDCLQLGDKGQLFSRSTELRERYWDVSRRRIESVVKKFEGLRNNLAHSQDIITENWDSIVQLSESLDALLTVHDES